MFKIDFFMTYGLIFFFFSIILGHTVFIFFIIVTVENELWLINAILVRWCVIEDKISKRT